MIEREAYGLRVRILRYGDDVPADCDRDVPHVGFGIFCSLPGEDRWIGIARCVTCSIQPEVTAIAQADEALSGELKSDAYRRFLALRGRPWTEIAEDPGGVIDEEAEWIEEAEDSGALGTILREDPETLGMAERGSSRALSAEEFDDLLEVVSARLLRLRRGRDRAAVLADLGLPSEPVLGLLAVTWESASDRRAALIDAFCLGALLGDAAARKVT